MKRFIPATILFVALLISSAIYAQTIRVGDIGITVKDMERSVKFYRDVLGFEKIWETEVFGEPYEKKQGLFGLRMKIVRMQLGEESIELTDYLTSGGRSIPEDAKSNDLFFQHIAIVVSDMEKAYRHLRGFNVDHVSTAPQTIPQSNAAAAGIKAFYFKDPDGHTLELIHFPKGKGQPKWQVNNNRLFLGIDHTAIGISNTERSLQFYQTLLGLERQGDSWNNGPEQEHLNFVEGARLHITGLRAPAGPGVEFLEYLHPGAGKPYPHDSKTDDIWHWQTNLFVADAEALYRKLKQAGAGFISKEIVHLEDSNHRYRAFIVRDPDGHALQIIERIQ